jgi:hypothetical protein
LLLLAAPQRNHAIAVAQGETSWTSPVVEALKREVEQVRAERDAAQASSASSAAPAAEPASADEALHNPAFSALLSWCAEALGLKETETDEDLWRIAAELVVAPTPPGWKKDYDQGNPYWVDAAVRHGAHPVLGGVIDALCRARRLGITPSPMHFV